MRELATCQCTGSRTACLQLASQEDLLCNGCRDNNQRCATIIMESQLGTRLGQWHTARWETDSIQLIELTPA